MDVGSTSGDSGVDANSETGELVSDASVELVTKDGEGKTPLMVGDDMDVIETSSTSACIPMNIDKETM
jgi:hypothetical protein